MFLESQARLQDDRVGAGVHGAAHVLTARLGEHDDDTRTRELAPQVPQGTCGLGPAGPPLHDCDVRRPVQAHLRQLPRPVGLDRHRQALVGEQ